MDIYIYIYPILRVYIYYIYIIYIYMYFDCIMYAPCTMQGKGHIGCESNLLYAICIFSPKSQVVDVA